MDRKKRPSIDSLYYSKEIEFVSSYAISVHWPAKANFNENDSDENKLTDYELFVQKSRVGTTGAVELRIDPSCLKLVEDDDLHGYAQDDIF